MLELSHEIKVKFEKRDLLRKETTRTTEAGRPQANELIPDEEVSQNNLKSMRSTGRAILESPNKDSLGQGIIRTTQGIADMAKIIVIFRNAQQKWSKLKATYKRHEIMQIANTIQCPICHESAKSTKPYCTRGKVLAGLSAEIHA